MQEDDIPLKRCTKCPEGEQWHPATPEFFSRHKSRKGGLQGQCKKCASDYHKAYRQRPETKEHKSGYDKAYRQRPETKEHKSDLYKIWRQKNPSRDKDLKKKYAQSHPERMRIASEKHAQSHPGIYKERSKRWAQSHPEIRAMHRRNRRARVKSARGMHTALQIQELLKRQKHRCYYCSTRFDRIKGKYIYHVDHTFPLSRVAGTDIPANDISYLVLTCPHCNVSKNDKFPWEWPEGGRLL